MIKILLGATLALLSVAQRCCNDIQCGPNATCLSGMCQCNEDWENCDEDWVNGCEADLTGALHCGGCERNCGPMECVDYECFCDSHDDCLGTHSLCSGGSCMCLFPYANCDDNWANGCESTEAPPHCGACYNDCPSFEYNRLCRSMAGHFFCGCDSDEDCGGIAPVCLPTYFCGCMSDLDCPPDMACDSTTSLCGEV